jgi:hypothetical protein
VELARRFSVVLVAAAATVALIASGSGTSWAGVSTDYAVDGTASDTHTLNLFIGGPQCDPDNGETVCLYAVRGHYDDSAGTLGTGFLNGRFKLDTTSFDGPIGGRGCFHILTGVLKFTSGPNRIRFKMSKTHRRKPGSSTICQTWDGTTTGVNGPDRTVHLKLLETTGACAGQWCAMFTSGVLLWDSASTFDPGAQFPTYDDAAKFEGSLTGP